MLVPVLKNKREIQNCFNCIVIKLISLAMKLWERVIERQLRLYTGVSDNQFGVMGRSTLPWKVFLNRKLMLRFREKRKDLHMVIIDLREGI